VFEKSTLTSGGPNFRARAQRRINHLWLFGTRL
jgi:hypothetical protein